MCDGNGKNGRKRVLTEKSQKEWELWMDEKKEKEKEEEKDEEMITKIDYQSDSYGHVGIKKIEKEVQKEVEKNVKKEGEREEEKEVVVDDDPHDTVGLICLDNKGHLACGTSTSGYIQF